MAEGRKIVYFLGAGASVAAGAYARVQGGGRLPIPTRRDFWAAFFRLSRQSKARRRIESFLFRYYLGHARVPSRLSAADRRAEFTQIDVEDVFTFLSERVGAPSTDPNLRRAFRIVWRDLVNGVGAIFLRFKPNASTRRTYKKLLVKHVRTFDVVVSFNYDTVFESSLPGRRRWGYGEIEECEGRLRILKPHGSVSWDLRAGTIRRSSQPATPVIVAPSHLKFVPYSGAESGTDETYGYLNQSDQVRAVWSAMEKHMTEAKALVFIGYSFPTSDLYFSSLLRSVFAARGIAPGVVLVNPDAIEIAKQLHARFFFSERLVTYFDLGQYNAAGRDEVLKQFGT